MKPKPKRGGRMSRQDEGWVIALGAALQAVAVLVVRLLSRK